jgi:predicted nucleic acid-binding protein
VSVVTYAELRAGVLAAKELGVRSRRLSTLQAVADLEPLPIDTAVADEWARLRLLLAEAGRRVNVNDTWIAATALAHGVPVVSQDHDYEALAKISGLQVIAV